jgi:hypothetical protein
MTDAIIGGAIAAVLGAVGGAITGLLLERRREKAQRLTIVDALITETNENLKSCKTIGEGQLWWAITFKLKAYDAYKGQLFFLPKDVRVKLADAVFVLEQKNTICQIMQQAASFGQNFETKPMPTAHELIEHLEFVDKELRKWRKEHTH